jgi:hypothetical protein
MQGPNHDGHWPRGRGEAPMSNCHWFTSTGARLSPSTRSTRVCEAPRPDHKPPTRAYAHIPVRSPSYVSSCSEFMARCRYSLPGLWVQGGARARIYTSRQRNQAQVVWIRVRNPHRRSPKTSAQPHVEDSNSVTLGGQTDRWNPHSRHGPTSVRGSRLSQGGL